MNPKRICTLRGYAAFAVFGTRGIAHRVLTGVRVVRQSDGIEVEWRPRVVVGDTCRRDELQGALEYSERWIIERVAVVPL